MYIDLYVCVYIDERDLGEKSTLMFCYVDDKELFI